MWIVGPVKNLGITTLISAGLWIILRGLSLAWKNGFRKEGYSKNRFTSGAAADHK